VLGDKGYSEPRVRRWCERRGIGDVIPQRSDQREHDDRRVFSRSIYMTLTVVDHCLGWLNTIAVREPDMRSWRRTTSPSSSSHSSAGACGYWSRETRLAPVELFAQQSQTVRGNG